jgi:hypothetical protein
MITYHTIEALRRLLHIILGSRRVDREMCQQRPVSTGYNTTLVAVAEPRVHGQYTSIIDERRRLLEELFDIRSEAYNGLVLGPYQPISLGFAPAARLQQARPGVL